MPRVAILQIQNITPDRGLDIFLQIGEDGMIPDITMSARLPENSGLAGLYECWRNSFQTVAQGYDDRHLPPELEDDDEDDDITPESGFISHRAYREEIADCRVWFRQLEADMQAWLQQPHDREWQRIREQLQWELGRNPDGLRLVIQAKDPALWKLPWLAWDLLQAHPQVGIAFSPVEYQKTARSAVRRRGKVRILAVFGDSRHIDLEPDRQAIRELAEAETVFLDRPDARSLIQMLRDDRGWDIFFFAGHSRSQGGTGCIEINENEGLEIDQFRNAVGEAIARGLKIAIFNSCDGLGLARRLADLQVPAIVAMQESVPDVVAQSFLTEFLREYARGQSLYAAVRRSQERLEAFVELPGATALPVVFQHPAEVPPTWEELRGGVAAFSWRQQMRILLAVSLAVTGLVMGVRWWGKLQAWELQAFDVLMRQLPPESADSRLLVVGMDEEDIREYGHPLPDAVLARLFQALGQYNPAAIGLDIVRDTPVESRRERPVPPDDAAGHAALVDRFQQNPNSIGVCAFGNSLKNSIGHLPEIPAIQTGFADLYYDIDFNRTDETTRRYLLARNPNPIDLPSRCTTDKSFAWKLVYRYLLANDIKVDSIPEGWQFGSVKSKRLNARSGGYQTLDARGDQILIRYRNTEKIAQEVSVRDVLEQREVFNPEWVKNRIVLVGITAASVPDVHDTPYGKMRGLYIHGNVISQLLSAIDPEENRPLFWYWSQFGDTIWVFFWSLAGGVAVCTWQASIYRGLAIGISGGILYGMCWFIFTKGGWIPLVPAAIALVGTAMGVRILISIQRSMRLKPLLQDRNLPP
jgi:CHASE2 domain-containing sensor protein